jgi:acyl carrier protein
MAGRRAVVVCSTKVRYALRGGLKSVSFVVSDCSFFCSTFRELGLDSLDEVEVVMMLEEEFVIDIQDEVASTILSPLDAINYISQHPFAIQDHDDDPHGHAHH